MTINAVRKRNPKAHITLGGPHPIMFPEYTIRADRRRLHLPLGDGVATSSSTWSTPWTRAAALEGIAGLWFKDADGTIVRNEKRRELKDISWQIWPDRSPAAATATTGCPAPSSPW